MEGRKTGRILSLICFLLFAGSVFSWHEARAEGTNAQQENLLVYIPTDYYNPAPGRFDGLRMVTAVRPENAGAVVDEARAILPERALDGELPPRLYLSSKRSLEEQRKIIDDIKHSLSEKFPDLPELEVVYPESDKGAEKRAHATNDALSRWYHRPASVRTYTKIHAGLLAAIAVGQDAGQFYFGGVDWNNPATALTAATAVLFGQAAFTYFTNRYEDEIGRFQTSHPWFFFPRFFGEKIKHFYRHSKHAQLAKGYLTNLPLFSWIPPSLFQIGNHLVSPLTVPWPWIPELSRWTAMGLTQGGTYFLGYQGLEAARQKGMSGTKKNLFLRLASVLNTATGIVNQSGQKKLVETVLPYLAGALWTFEASPGVALLLAPQNNRIVLVDPKIEDRADIDNVEALESTHPVTESVTKSVKEIQKGEKIRRGAVQIGGHLVGRPVRAGLHACAVVYRSLASRIPRPFKRK